MSPVLGTGPPQKSPKSRFYVIWILIKKKKDDGRKRMREKDSALNLFHPPSLFPIPFLSQWKSPCKTVFMELDKWTWYHKTCALKPRKRIVCILRLPLEPDFLDPGLEIPISPILKSLPFPPLLSRALSALGFPDSHFLPFPESQGSTSPTLPEACHWSRD